jgi:hypothetical protein
MSSTSFDHQRSFSALIKPAGPVAARTRHCAGPFAHQRDPNGLAVPPVSVT